MLGGMDTERKEGETGIRWKQEQWTHHNGLLGETREELFIANLHINDSFLPLMTSLLHVEITMYAQYVCMCTCVHVSLSAFNYLATGKFQQIFCLFPACLTIARFWSLRWDKPTGSSPGSLLTTIHTYRQTLTHTSRQIPSPCSPKSLLDYLWAIKLNRQQPTLHQWQ